MGEVVTILFPPGTGADTLDALQADLPAIDGFTGAGSEATRSVGIAELALWVGFAGDALGLVTAAAAILQKLVAKVRGRGIRERSSSSPTASGSRSTPPRPRTSGLSCQRGTRRRPSGPDVPRPAGRESSMRREILPRRRRVEEV